MNIQKKFCLAPLTTMRVGGVALYFTEVKTLDECRKALSFAQEEKCRYKVIGAGSNIVFADTGFQGLVIKMGILGWKVVAQDIHNVYVHAGAGESWDPFVATMVKHNFFGLENLSLIPGTVGAAPVQNIGAYGVEVGQYIETVHVYDCKSRTTKDLSSLQCSFGYRDSIFKHKEGADFVVVGVTFKLRKRFTKNTQYTDLVCWENEHGTLKTATEVRDAVVAIRLAKLPDPNTVATAGSFWKNTLVKNNVARALVLEYPGLPVYPHSREYSKVSTGWILDKVLHKKGYKEGRVGLYEKQALAVVSENATEKEISFFAKKIEKEFFEKTKIKIEREVEFIF